MASEKVGKEGVASESVGVRVGSEGKGEVRSEVGE